MLQIGNIERGVTWPEVMLMERKRQNIKEGRRVTGRLPGRCEGVRARTGEGVSLLPRRGTWLAPRKGRELAKEHLYLVCAHYPKQCPAQRQGVSQRQPKGGTLEVPPR